MKSLHDYQLHHSTYNHDTPMQWLPEVFSIEPEGSKEEYIRQLVLAEEEEEELILQEEQNSSSSLSPIQKYSISLQQNESSFDSYVDQLLDSLSDDYSNDYNNWLLIGFILFNTYQGSDLGFKKWDEEVVRHINSEIDKDSPSSSILNKAYLGAGVYKEASGDSEAVYVYTKNGGATLAETIPAKRIDLVSREKEQVRVMPFDSAGQFVMGVPDRAMVPVSCSLGRQRFGVREANEGRASLDAQLHRASRWRDPEKHLNVRRQV